MTNDFPAPLVPAEVDLTDFRFMPLEVRRLRRSKTWLMAKRDPRIGFYAMNLWCESWHERPAASLPDDDDMLADMAMCPIDDWAALKPKIMHGWVLCSDRRWYHPVVAEKARESWIKKVDQRRRTEAARVGKLKKRLEGETNPLERRRLEALIAEASESALSAKAASVTGHETVSVTDSVSKKPQAEDPPPQPAPPAEADPEIIEHQRERIGRPTEPKATDPVVGDASPSEKAKARRFIELFDQAQAEAYAEQRRNFPHNSDFPTALKWSKAGVTEDICEAVCRAGHQAMQSKRKRPPLSLSYFDQPMADAIASLNRPMPTGAASHEQSSHGLTGFAAALAESQGMGNTG